MNNITEMKEAIDNSDMDTEMKAKLNNFFQVIEKTYIRVPRIYYAGAVYGLGSATFGVFSTNFFVVVCGIAMFLVTLVGILEVICIRRKIGGIK
ncbi:hypothetical protein KAW18_02770 [candidate division WOR-3 bacterium]|nr:hypothetical protein [candidate division WOR-3 bacterium]